MANQSNIPKRKDQPIREDGTRRQGDRQQPPGAPNRADERIREAQGEEEQPQPRPRSRK
ncbi:MAG: hypothetical protein H6716_02805 [Polyangiaceae bacterium]|nr:hypothetical protein [Polyangiaceae bacterium]